MTIIKILLYISLAISLLSSSSIKMIEPKLAIKMVKQKNIKFISAEEESVGIINSVVIPIHLLYNVDVLGNHTCSPLYACSSRMEKIIKKLNITKDNQLIIYDKTYGIYASTLYTTLESMGYTNISLLNGGYSSIAQLDPNQKAYDEYVAEENEVRELLRKENSKDLILRYHSLLKTLKKKILVLKPLLLVQPIAQQNYPFFKDKVEKQSIDLTHLSTKLELKLAIKKIEEKGIDSNITLIDACNMVNILEKNSSNGSEMIDSLSWKNIIDKKREGIKSKKLLKKMFLELGLRKENLFYIYCMSESEKAFYMQVALRIAEYNKIKVFSGNWDTWIGAKIE